jgi:O-antigen ligase
MKEKILRILDFLFEYPMLALIFLLPAIFSLGPFLRNSFELPKEEFFRCSVFLALLAFLAASFIRRKIEWRFSWRYPAAVLLIVSSWFLSSIFSIHPALSFSGSYSRLQGFFLLIFYAIFFLLLLIFLNSGERARKLIWVAVFSSLIPSFYGSLQFFKLDPMRWSEYFGRVFSTIGQPNLFGHYLILVIPLTLYATFFLARRFWPRFFLAILFLLQLFCLYATLSRAAWIGFFAEIFVFILFYIWLKKRKEIFVLVLLAVFFFAAVVGGIYFCQKKNIAGNSVNRLVLRVESVFDWSVGSGSNRARLNYWQAGISAWSEADWERKIFGFGPDALSDVFAARYRPEWSLDERIYSWPDRAHNFIIDLFLQFGLFGLVAAAAAWMIFLKEILPFLRRLGEGERYYLAVFSLIALAGYFTNNLASFSLTVQYVFFSLLTALAISAAFDQPLKSFNLRLSAASRWTFILFLVVFSGIFVFGRAIKVLAADHQYALARKISFSDSCRSLFPLKKAIILNTAENSYREEYLFQGLTCLKKISSSEEKNNLKDNLFNILAQIPAKERTSFARLVEADLLSDASLGDEKLISAAEEKFRNFLKDYPFFGRAYVDDSGYKAQRGDWAGAIAVLSEKLERVFPKDWEEKKISPDRRKDIVQDLTNTYELLGSLCQTAGRSDKALDYYHKVLESDPYRLPVYKKIADIYYQRKDYDKALWYNERGYSLNPSDYVWPLAIGLVYQAKGDGKAAISYLEKSRLLAPEDKKEEIKKFLNYGKK